MIKSIGTCVVGAGLLVAAAAPAFAQTCDNPLPLPANQIVTHDSCDDPTTFWQLAGGALAVNQPDTVFSFEDVIRRNGITSKSVVVWPSSHSFDAIVEIASTCSETAPAIDLGGGTGDPVVVPESPAAIAPLHRYYVVVTGDPSRAPGSSCGPFSILRTAETP